MKTSVLAVAIVLGAILNTASAQTIHHKAKNQHHRVAQGVKSGELTRSETRNLARDQRGIHREVRSAKADGVVTRHERRNIKKDQRHESRKIYRKKHNNRDRN